MSSWHGTQRAARQYRDDLVLVPPLAEEFSVYGGLDTTARARAWALGHHYLLADGIPACAHGLYLLGSCPGPGCRSSFPQLDHAGIWVPADPTDKPFLLAHPYATDAADETRTYARAHGLDVRSLPQFGDNWYGHGTIPVRLTVTENWPLWPIEAKVAIMLSTQPVTWPDEG